MTEDLIVLLAGLTVLISFLGLGALIGDAILGWRDTRAQRRRDNRAHYTRRMK